MAHLYPWFKKEIIKVIPAVLFFGAAFNLIVFTDSLLLKEYEVRLNLSYLAATIGALLVAKIIIIADSLKFVDAFPNKPLIYNIVWKICFYGVLTLVFRILEDVLYLVSKHENFVLIHHYISHKLASPSFWVIQVWLFILFAIYIVADEFVRVLGKKQIKKILFG